MPESIADFPPQEIKGTRGYLVMRVCEDNDGLFVHGCVYDGNPEPLQTPEGVLESELHDEPAAAGIEWCAAINGIESLILAHACAGIDVTAPAYVEGIETAVNFATNEFD